ncbi:MAG: iron-regulated protein [Hahellaceae bacterium]|nr:iron-regulated protein [Hahellaceae bacterium]
MTPFQKIGLFAGITMATLVQSAPKEADIALNYANIVHAVYEDSLLNAQQLQQNIAQFLSKPSTEALSQTKASYRALRVSYQQSEVFRFDSENGHVTPGLESDGGPASIDDWEGQVNAWPLDEALIDYVSQGYEGEYNQPENIINQTKTLTVGTASVDVSQLTPALLASLNELGGAEANVTTGIHAIEFLLWGQDTQGTGPGAGNRPISDYFTQASQGSCTSGATVNESAAICQRRADYLTAAAQLLVDDLTTMTNEWTPNARQQKGTLGYDFLTRGDALARVLDSMGDLAVGELASERMKVAILFGSTEDEHDCFSDLTHVAIQNNAQGVVNAYTGKYIRRDGQILSGPSLSDLVRSKAPEVDRDLLAQLATISKQMQAISEAAENGKRFDQLVGGSAEDKALVLNAAESLVQLGEPLSNAVAPLLKLKTENFDPGTCPGKTQESCATEG